MTDNKEKDNNTTPKPEEAPMVDGPKGQTHQSNPENQERLQKRIEELRKRDPFIYR